MCVYLSVFNQIHLIFKPEISFSQGRSAAMGFITFTAFEITTVACFVIVGGEILLNLSECTNTMIWTSESHSYMMFFCLNARGNLKLL